MAYTYECDNDPFEVTSEDRDEVVDMVQQHAKNNHDMDVDASDIRDGMRET